MEYLRRFSLSPAHRVLLIVVPSFAVFGILIYSDVLFSGGFVFDDYNYITDNYLIRDLSFFSNIAELRYVGYLTFALNYRFGGFEPEYFHLFNIAVHYANAVLVYLLSFTFIRLTRRDNGYSVLSGEWVIPVCTALIFLAHPLATESVSYISQRFSSLSAFFYLSAVLSYLSGREHYKKGNRVINGYLVMAFIFTLLGMKTKESFFTLPAMLVILEFVFFGADTEMRSKRWLILIPFLATMIIIPLSMYGPDMGLFKTPGGIFEQSRKDKVFDLYYRSGKEYLLTQFSVIVTYLRLMAAPYGQRVVYDYPYFKNFFEVRIILSFVFLVVLAYSGGQLLKRSSRSVGWRRVEERLAGLGIIWFFVTISVESSIIPIKDTIFEHRTYLPSFGIYLAFAVLFSMGMRSIIKQYKPAVFLSVFLIISCALGVAAYQRNRIWVDSIALWNDAVIKAPGRPDVWQNRGWEFFHQGRFNEALNDLDKSISLAELDHAQGATKRSPDVVLMQLASAYRDRAAVYNLLGNKKDSEWNRMKMEEYLNMLSKLTGLSYIR